MPASSNVLLRLPPSPSQSANRRRRRSTAIVNSVPTRPLMRGDVADLLLPKGLAARATAQGLPPKAAAGWEFPRRVRRSSPRRWGFSNKITSTTSAISSFWNSKPFPRCLVPERFMAVEVFSAPVLLTRALWSFLAVTLVLGRRRRRAVAAATPAGDRRHADSVGRPARTTRSPPRLGGAAAMTEVTGTECCVRRCWHSPHSGAAGARHRIGVAALEGEVGDRGFPDATEVILGLLRRYLKISGRASGTKPSRCPASAPSERFRH